MKHLSCGRIQLTKKENQIEKPQRIREHLQKKKVNFCLEKMFLSNEAIYTDVLQSIQHLVQLFRRIFSRIFAIIMRVYIPKYLPHYYYFGEIIFSVLFRRTKDIPSRC